MSNNLQQNLDVVQTRLVRMIDQAKAELMQRPELTTAPADLRQQLSMLEGVAFIEALLNARLMGIEDCCAELKRVDAALCQLDLGLYGLCSDCEESIEPELLQADPCRQRCRHCERRHQRRDYASRLML